MRRYYKGEVTVYLSLIFILLVTFVGGVMESASIQIAKNYRRADTNRAMECVFAEYQKELLEEYDIFALEVSYETGQYAEQNLTDRLAYYGAGDMEHKVERIQFLTDRGCSGFYDQVAIYMEQKYGMDVVKDMLGLSSVWEQQEERVESYSREEQEQQENLNHLLRENESELPDEDNPINHVGQLKRSSILSLVVPKDIAISEKMVEEQELLSSRERNEGYGEFSDVASGNGKLSTLLFGEYLLEHFSEFTDTEKTGTLDYELEYILAGKSSDKENLEAVVKRLLLLRFVPNYAYIQTDGEMRAEAQAMALTLCALLAVPAITEAAAQGILLAWAYGESIMDIRSLLKGNRVPLVKSKESWQLQLSGLLTLGTEEDHNDGQDISDGLAYQEYLRILLFLGQKNTIALRAIGMIEQNMRKIYGQPYFHADQCINRMEIKTTCKLRRGITYQYKTYYGYQ
ncbi:DUF5702 domain-containing protein [Bariatricus sp. SGI.154]|uniref:DUF5702 domain-containing protein n=1 Tax=Bariatricus sp. SGI.154 TaxID=3420549 RepID=UPI003D01A933